MNIEQRSLLLHVVKTGQGSFVYCYHTIFMGEKQIFLPFLLNFLHFAKNRKPSNHLQLQFAVCT